MDSKCDFYKYFHTGYTTNLQYVDTFNNKVSVIKLYVGPIETDPGLKNIKLREIITNPGKTGEDGKKTLENIAKHKYL